MKTRKLKLLGAAALLLGLIVPAQSAEITTLDGKTYKNVFLVRREPDGLVIRYQPERGIAMAKVYFRNLPDSLRNEYGYNANDAAAFESASAQGVTSWREQLTKTDALKIYKSFSELHRSVVGDNISSSYTITIDADGKLTVQDEIQPYPYLNSYNPYMNSYNSYYPWTSGISTENGFQPIGSVPFGSRTAIPITTPIMARPPFWQNQ